MKRRFLFLIVLLFALGALATLPAGVRAQKGGHSYVVNTLSDNIAVDFLCTFREAITSSNGTTTDCGVNSGAADVISFSVDGTIVLASALPAIDDDVTIDGSGHSIAISGNSTLDILSVNSSTTLSLTNLTLAYGHVAITNNGTLVITNSTLANNANRSLYNKSTATIATSTISNNEGNIKNIGTLTVGDSSFVNNASSSGAGGAIENYGTLSVGGSTFVKNNGNGGGGAIFNAYGTATISNSTFFQNSAQGGGGIDVDSGTVDILNTTFSQNTASDGTAILFYQGSVTLWNTLILGNQSAPSCSIGLTNITDGSNNLSYPDTTCPGIHQDPKLDPGGLKNNGGPTKTILLMPGSPARDGGDNTTCQLAPVNNLDQRGQPRPIDGDGNISKICDIGAVEVPYTAPAPTPTPIQCASAPARPTLKKPDPDATVTTTRPRLKWNAAACAVTYKVVVRDAVTGAKVDGKKGLTVFNYKTKTLIHGMTYKWFVKACNTHGCTKSLARKFTVQ